MNFSTGNLNETWDTNEDKAYSRCWAQCLKVNQAHISDQNLSLLQSSCPLASKGSLAELLLGLRLLPFFFLHTHVIILIFIFQHHK